MLKISEPTTLFTDYILCAETLVLGLLLLKAADSQSHMPVRLWSFAFFGIAIAALTGGTFHGFPQSLSQSTLTALWKITVISIGLADLLMLLAVFYSLLPSKWHLILTFAAILKFIIYAAWMMTHDDFKYVILDYVPSMILILLLEFFVGRHSHPESAKWIIGGILLSFGGAGVQQSGFSFHKHFNFNDIYHVIQMIAMYLLYRGAKA